MLEFLYTTMIMSGYLLGRHNWPWASVLMLWCVFALFSGMWNLFFVIFDPTYLVCILVYNLIV